jgi:hypothetical protein
MAESITVVWAWRQVGKVGLVDGKLVSPRVANVAGVYRFTFSDRGGQRTSVYVGEADPLPRRFQHYRTPGSRQQTNLRMNPILLGTLAAGGQVAVEIATHAEVIAAGGGRTPVCQCR